MVKNWLREVLWWLAPLLVLMAFTVPVVQPAAAESAQVPIEVWCQAEGGKVVYAKQPGVPPGCQTPFKRITSTEEWLAFVHSGPDCVVQINHPYCYLGGGGDGGDY